MMGSVFVFATREKYWIHCQSAFALNNIKLYTYCVMHIVSIVIFKH